MGGGTGVLREYTTEQEAYDDRWGRRAETLSHAAKTAWEGINHAGSFLFYSVHEFAELAYEAFDFALADGKARDEWTHNLAVEREADWIVKMQLGEMDRRERAAEITLGARQ